MCVCARKRVCTNVRVPKQLPSPSRSSVGTKELTQVTYAKIYQSCKTIGSMRPVYGLKKGCHFSNSPCQKVIRKNEEMKLLRVIR